MVLLSIKYVNYSLIVVFVVKLGVNGNQSAKKNLPPWFIFPSSKH